jgi:hypothetical protein
LIHAQIYTSISKKVSLVSQTILVFLLGRCGITPPPLAAFHAGQVDPFQDQS